MAGFPTRIRRSTLGPTLVNTYKITDPTKAVPAETFNLDYWQLAGMNLTAAIALLGVRMVTAASAPVTFFQGLAFDPNQAQPLLSWTRDGVGIYSYSFPQSEYPDEVGNDVTLSFIGGDAFCQGLTGGGDPIFMHHERTGPRSGTVRAVSGGVIELPQNEEFILRLY